MPKAIFPDLVQSVEELWKMFEKQFYKYTTKCIR